MVLAGRPFVPLLDSIASSGLYGVYAVKRVLTTYRGPLFTVRRDYDSATMDVYPMANGWPNTSAILAWLDGFVGFITTWYDQSGGGRNFTQATAIKQPQLKFEGAYPVIDFIGNATAGPAEFDGTATLAGVAQNVGALSVIVVRQHDVVPALQRTLAFVSTNAGSTRAAVVGTSTGFCQVSGRRLDANGNVTQGTIAADTSWRAEFGRWDYANAHLVHDVDATSETKASFQTAGSTSNTASTYVGVGGDTGTGTNMIRGKMSMVVFSQALLSDTQVAALVASLVPLKVARTSTDPDWVKNALNGNYTLLTSQTNYTILDPSGATPTEGDLTTHKFHHHTQIAVDGGGRIWDMFSSGGTNEDAGGQQTAIVSSNDGGTTWSAAAVVCPSQSTFSGTGASYQVGSRISYPRAFVTYAGNLYAVAAVDGVLGSNSLTGDALVACKCNTDGTLGAVFRISSAAYTAQDGKADIAYDGTLGPPIYALAKLYGTWGGSSPGNTSSDWLGWYAKDGENWVEPATINLNAVGTSLFRFWRRTTNTTRWWWGQKSTDSGASWDTLRALNIPNDPSAGAALRLTDGRLAFVFNPINNGAVGRDPLAIALFDPTTGLVSTSSIRAIRQGLTNNPVYAGTNKAGGAQYPGVFQNGDDLWISYDIHKETVAATKLSIATNLP